MSNAQRQLIRDSLSVWAPNWPRNVNRRQQETGNAVMATEHLLEAQREDGNSPFISVYSFPRGHTKKDNIPRVDTLFIDFDFEGGDYKSGSGDRDAWRRDMSKLLVRVRRVAAFLKENGRSGWRASLSGHKGVHLFLDFPALPTDLGEFGQYVAGLNNYANDLIHKLSEETGLRNLERYVDVTSSDLGRLCRVPNTVHGGATNSFGERRFCVPVSLAELAEIDVDEYESLTQAPRAVPYTEREPNSDVGEIVARQVRTARAGSSTAYSGESDVNWSRVEQYQEQSNDNIELEDIEFITSDRPCVWEFYKRDDKYRHGFESHFMELFCIQELLEKRVPIDVIKEFLDSAPEYNERETEQRIKQLISRNYNRFSVEKAIKKAPTFMRSDGCEVCEAATP